MSAYVRACTDRCVCVYVCINPRVSLCMCLYVCFSVNNGSSIQQELSMESGIDPGQDYYTQDYYNYDHGLVCFLHFLHITILKGKLLSYK